MEQSANDRRRCTAASYRPTGNESSRRPRASCNRVVAYAILGKPAIFTRVRDETAETPGETGARSREGGRHT